MEIKKNNWSLYRHTTPSHKVYIGITSQKPEYRWNNGRGYFNCKKTKFKSSIIKYGWNNIKHEVLFSNLEEGRAKKLEMELIRHYKSLGMSLNCTDGGEGVIGVIPWNKGIKVPYEKSNKLRGTHLSEEHKRKLSISHKGKSYGKGRKMTEKQMELLRKINTGRVHSEAEKIQSSLNSANNRKVVELDVEGNIIGEFRSATVAAKKYSIDQSWLARACRKQLFCHGHIFAYFTTEINYRNIVIYKCRRNYKYDFDDFGKLGTPKQE